MVVLDAETQCELSWHSWSVLVEVDPEIGRYVPRWVRPVVAVRQWIAARQVEARLRRTCKGGRLPILPRGDAGPKAAGRGPVEMTTVLVESHDVWADAAPMITETVVRRAPGHGLKALNEFQKATALRYAGLVERASSVAGPGTGSSGGISDGGASTRIEIAAAVRQSREAIGNGLVKLGSDKGQKRLQGRPISVAELLDAVCLEGRSIRSVLWRAGWPVTKATKQDGGLYEPEVWSDLV